MGIISGIVSAVVDAVSTAATVIGGTAAGIAGDVGLGGIAGTVGSVVGTGVEGALAGGALGGVESAITGKDIGQGIIGGLEGGAITGGAIGLGPTIAGATGLSTGLSDTLAGAAGGAASSAVTGGNPLLSAAGGALAGGEVGAAWKGSSGAPSAGAGGGGPSGAAATAAPASVGATAPDLGLSGSDTGAVSPLQPGGQLTPSIVPNASVGASAPSPADYSSLPGDFSTNTGATPGNVGLGAAAPGGSTATTGITGTTPASTAGGGLGSKLLGGIEKNPVTALALGADLLKGNQMPKGFDRLQTEANQLAAQGAQSRNYLASGTLPPGMQAGLDAASQEAQATIRAEYAARGMSGSSAEAQDLAAVNQRTVSQGEQLAAQLFATGVSETQAADQLYSELMNVQMQQDSNLSSSIGNLVGAFSKMGTPLYNTGG